MSNKIRGIFDTTVVENQASFWINAVNDVLIVAVTDLSGRIIHVNDRFCLISGYTRDELVGKNHRILNSGMHDKGFFVDMFRTIRAGRTWRGEIRNRAKDGSLYWVATTIIPEMDSNGRIIRYVACRFDITEQKEAQRRLADMATRDALTGLLNRHGLQDRLSQILESAGRHGSEIHVVMLDIDHFKDVNDVNGHDVGDHVLRTIGARLDATIGASGFAARLGGDEIAIVLEGSDHIGAAHDLFNRLLVDVRAHIDLGGRTISVTASLGTASFPKDGRSASDLIKNADLALYAAKRQGRDRFVAFEHQMVDRNRRRIALREQAAIGIERGEFDLFYQPIIATGEGVLPSYEALLRWHHPEKGLLAPGAFQDVMESPRLMKAIGEVVQRLAIQQAADWIAIGIPFGRLKFNTSSADFDEPGYARRLLASLSAAGVPIDRIGVEVTEGMFLGQKSNTVQHELTLLHEAGIETAFDDFGTGFASLTHLRDLPIRRLKIDRSFVKNLGNSERDETIIRGVVHLAHKLGILVTAEGVETFEQFVTLEQIGCNDMQGYYFSSALPAVEATRFLRERASLLSQEKAA